MPTGQTPQLDRFTRSVDGALSDITTLRATLERFSDGIGDTRELVEKIDSTGDLAEDVRLSIDAQLRTLTITKQAGPLKLPSKVYESALDIVRPFPKAVEDVVERIRDIGGASGRTSPVRASSSTRSRTGSRRPRRSSTR